MLFVPSLWRNFINLNNYVELSRRFKANRPLSEPGPVGVLPSLEVFLRDPSPYSEKTTENS